MTKLDKYKKIYQVGGPKAVADMLNETDHELRQKWLLLIRMENPELAEQISELMFTFEDLARISDRDMQTLIRAISYDDLLVALKSTSGALRVKVLLNLSKNQRDNFEDDFKSQKKHKVSQVRLIQKKIVDIAKELEKENKINLHPDTDKMVE